MIAFAEPLFLATGVLFCVGMVFLYRFLSGKRQQQLEEFAGSVLLTQLTRNVTPARRKLKAALVLAATMLIFTALARPQYGYTWTNIKQKGIDILLAIDTSKSMLTEDIKPNRLQRSRFAILDFVKQLKRDRIGLLPFAGTAFLACPLTLDYDAFTETLAALGPETIPQGGTNLAAVIREATAVLDNDANHKIFVLITDGENLQEDAIKEAQAAHAKGLTIHTLGVGTHNGEIIPLAATGTGGFVKDPQGKLVTSRLDEELLKKIADAAGGIYAPLGKGEGLDRIYQEKLALEPKKEIAEQHQKLPIEQASWPILAATFFLVLECLLPDQKGSRLPFPSFWPKLRQRLRRTGSTKSLILLLALSSIFLAKNGFAKDSGQEAYEKNDFLAASQHYASEMKKKPDDPVRHYNYATAAYKNNLFDEAIASFTNALKTTDLGLQAKTYFNLGNAFYQKGLESEKGDAALTRKQWQNALDAYDNALRLQPDNQNAKENRKLVEEALKKLEEQQKNSPEQNQEKDQKEKESKQSGENSEKRQSPQSSSQEKSPDTQDENKEKSGNNSADAKEEAKQPEKSDESKSSSDPSDSQPSPAKPEKQNEDSTKPAAEKTEENAREAQSAQVDERKDEERQRRVLGKMTREEAEKLLDSLKNDEGKLHYAPAPSDRSVEKDW